MVVVVLEEVELEEVELDVELDDDDVVASDDGDTGTIVTGSGSMCRAGLQPKGSEHSPSLVIVVSATMKEHITNAVHGINTRLKLVSILFSYFL